MTVYIYNESGQSLLGESIDETPQINVHGCKDGPLWLEEEHELCVDVLELKFTMYSFLQEIQSFLELHGSVFSQDKSWWKECPVENQTVTHARLAFVVSLRAETGPQNKAILSESLLIPTG